MDKTKLIVKKKLLRTDNSRLSSHSFALFAGLILCLAFPFSVHAAALVEPVQSDSRIIWPREPHGIIMPSFEGAQGALAPVAGIERFLSEAGPGWGADVDTLTGRPHRLYGGSINWSASGAAGQIGHDAAEDSMAAHMKERADTFLSAFRDLFALDTSGLVYDSGGSFSVGQDELLKIHYRHVYHGLPVRGSGVTFIVKHGRLVYISTSNLDDISINPSPDITSAMAVDAAWSRLLGGKTPHPKTAPAHLEILPYLKTDRELAFKLIWIVTLQGETGEESEWKAWIDAQDGTFAAFFPRDLAACDVFPEPVQRRMTGGIKLKRGDDAELIMPFPNIGVSDGTPSVTDLNGMYPYEGERIVAGLDGPYFIVQCITCSDPGQIEVESEPGGDIRLGFGPTNQQDVFGNGISNPSVRNALYHLSRLRLLARHWLVGSITWLDSSVTIEVNINNACNAMWTGYRIKTFRENEECRNTAHIADVLAHEWGHGLDDN
ncbi:hypothetical protein ACFLU6_13905, partial [Acidobacteriota bacterium]